MDGRFLLRNFMSTLTKSESPCSFSSGAQPLSAVQGPQLSAAAILGAIQDWDDVTESEFSDGHDVEEEE